MKAAPHAGSDSQSATKLDDCTCSASRVPHADDRLTCSNASQWFSCSPLELFVAFPPVLQNLPLPIIASPMFIISNPKLVIEQCKAGVVGSMPALNARPAELLDEWLAEITEALAAHNRAHPDQPAAPFAINQIVHRSNDRLEDDMALCEKYKVPIVITSLGAPRHSAASTSTSAAAS